MSLPTDLDAWTVNLSLAVGMDATRDPDLIFPPCLFVDLPPVSQASLPTMTLEIPVWIVAEGPGKIHMDAVLDKLPDVLDYCASRDAEPSTLTVGGQDFRGYRVNAAAVLELDSTPAVTPVPPSAPGLPVAVNWKRAEPGWYTFTMTWNPSVDEGSSPILYYRVNVDGNESPTDGPVTQVDNCRAQAGQTAYAYVYAVNSETVGPHSETSYLTAPPS